MDLLYVNSSSWWWWCNGLGIIFFAYIRSPKTNQVHNPAAYVCIVADRVHPFMTKIHPSSNNYVQHNNVPRHTAQAISHWFHDHVNEFNLLQRSFQSLDLNPIVHILNVV